MKMQIQECKKTLKKGMSTTRILLAAITFSLIAVSCNKEENEVGFTAEEAAVNAKIDIMNDDTSQIIEEQLTVDDGISGKTTDVTEKFTAVCATITRVPAFGTTPTVGSTITKTIDFGTSGCQLTNGNIVKGKIVITFAYQPNATSHTINYQFVDFYHNAIKFNGNKSFTRVMSTSIANPNMHPIVTMNMEMSATFPNGNIYTRVGTRVREIIEGYTTPILSDNVYKVTGNWTTTFPNANTQTSTITSPLIIKLNCPNITKGIITFVRNANTATLDYGDGTCDNLAVFTFNGTAFNIVLGN